MAAPSAAEIEAMVAALQREAPNLTSELCALLLDDFDYNLAEAISGCRELCAPDSGFAPPPNADALSSLRLLQPSLPDAELEFFLDAANGDPESASRLCAGILSSPPMAHLRARHPDAPDSELAFWLEAAGGDPAQAELLLSPDPSIEPLVRLGATPERARTLLEAAGGDIEAAADQLLTEEPSALDSLAAIFLTIDRAEIAELLEQTGGDCGRASAVLAARLDECPPPEGLILALRPDFTLEQARTVLRRARGNMREARRLARRAPRGPAGRGQVRDLWIDLHGQTAAETREIVREALASAAAAKNVGVIRFCTGRGKHSPGGVPVLRPLVLKLCQERGFAAALAKNQGVVCCPIGSAHV